MALGPCRQCVRFRHPSSRRLAELGSATLSYEVETACWLYIRSMAAKFSPAHARYQHTRWDDMAWRVLGWSRCGIRPR